MSGTEGYAQEADDLFKTYESLDFAAVHSRIFHLLPTAPSRILDIGAGTGRDAAGFAALGHRVVAAEPTDAMRTRAAVLHPSPRIEWVNDSLPDLPKIRARDTSFDVIMMTAVWMHLDEQQRRRAMPHVASLLAPGGIIALSLRYGPIPAGRRMFAVRAEETIEQAKAEGLHLLFNQHAPSDRLGREGVSWTRLAFRKPA